MEALKRATSQTPIIDNHAHNLLRGDRSSKYSLLSLTSEASGAALENSKSSLAHLRAVKNLATILGCEPSWNTVESLISAKRHDSYESWARDCFTGIETVLIDDGLDPFDVYPFEWHDRLVHSPCKRIIRIERVVEEIVTQLLTDDKFEIATAAKDLRDKFTLYIREAVDNPNVAGFKSVICYRTGLNVRLYPLNTWQDTLSSLLSKARASHFRLEDDQANPYFLHLAATTIRRCQSKKPLQFHTGLGDNDINLSLSNAAHLQTFIKEYPEINIVLLHASWPFTKEAAYLATVYENVYLDIGEVFPQISQDGQERVIREALDLCPSEKLLWSTDGHWFPETYLLAVVQFKEGFQEVLTEYVSRGVLTSHEAVQIVEDVYFNTSNKLYNLGLKLRPLSHDLSPLYDLSNQRRSQPNIRQLQHFLKQNPSIQFLQTQWLDYSSNLRTRILPVKQAFQLFYQNEHQTLTKAALGLLPADVMGPGFTSIGEDKLVPILSSLKRTSRSKYASINCEIQEQDGSELPICPRTLLRRQTERAEKLGVEFKVGHEIEVVYMRPSVENGRVVYGREPVSMEDGHTWSSLRAMHDSAIASVNESIVADLEAAGIDILSFHPESAPGQYEFILPPQPPLQSIDNLLSARQIIIQNCADAGLRATLYPKPFPQNCGSGAHIHLSLTPESHWQSFYAGVLRNLRALIAIFYSNEASYERVVDGVWAGGTWVAWGPQNRETPLRQISNSHFEVKAIDGLSNPYLSLAAILAVGLAGIRSSLPLEIQPCLRDPATLSEDERAKLGIREKLPRSLEEALTVLEGKEGDGVREALGREFVKTYVGVKRAEREMLLNMEEEERRNWLIGRY